MTQAIRALHKSALGERGVAGARCAFEARKMKIIVLLSVLLLPVFAWAQQPGHTLNFGGYFAEGRFNGHSDTRIRYLPVGYQWQGERWGFQLLASGLSVTGVGNVLVNIGEVTRAIAGTEVSTETGPGDTLAGVSYGLDPIAGWMPFIDLRFETKIPTADEQRSLGTGEFDYRLQVDLSQALGEYTWFASFGHNFRGRSELFPGLRDNRFAQFGLARQLTAATSIGAFYDYREAPADFALETHEIYPYASFRLGAGWSFTALVGRGFTEGSADYAIQGQLSYQW